MLDQNIERLVRDLVQSKHPGFAHEISKKFQAIQSQFARSGRDVSAATPLLKEACDRELERRASIIWDDMQRVIRANRMTWYPELAEDLKREMRVHLTENAGELTRVLRLATSPQRNMTPLAIAGITVENHVGGLYNAEIDLFVAPLRTAAPPDPVKAAPDHDSKGIWNAKLLGANKYRFFKYRECNDYTFDSIASSQLYGARPDELNDPFDCQINLRAALDRSARQATGSRREELTQLIQAKLPALENWHARAQELGVCAFSLIAPDDPRAAPLWSLYADEHKGVCLVYEFTEEYLNNPDNGYLGIDRVVYKDNPITEWLMKGEVAPRDGKFIVELLKKYVTAKSSRWGHEEEVRVLRPHHGLFAIPKASLVEIYLGLRVTDENANRIRSLAVKNTECKSVAKMTHADSDFGITVEKSQ